jgi:hypothetical protein
VTEKEIVYCIVFFLLGMTATYVLYHASGIVQ